MNALRKEIGYRVMSAVCWVLFSIIMLQTLEWIGTIEKENEYFLRIKTAIVVNSAIVGGILSPAAAIQAVIWGLCLGIMAVTFISSWIQLWLCFVVHGLVFPGFRLSSLMGFLAAPLFIWRGYYVTNKYNAVLDEENQDWKKIIRRGWLKFQHEYKYPKLPFIISLVGPLVLLCRFLIQERLQSGEWVWHWLADILKW